MAHEVIHMTLEEFEGGLVAPPTSDDTSVTIDGRRLDSKAAVLACGLRSPTMSRPRKPLARRPGELTTSPEGPDLKRLTDALARHDVEYLLVGGIASRA